MKILEQDLKELYYILDQQRWENGCEYVVYPVDGIATKANIGFCGSIEEADKVISDAEVNSVGKINASSLAYTLGRAINLGQTKVSISPGVLDITMMDKNRLLQRNPNSVSFPFRNTEKSNTPKSANRKPKNRQ